MKQSIFPIKIITTVFIILLFLIILNISLSKTSYLSDEWAHFQTINDIATNNISQETFSRNAQLPGYYFFMAIFKKYFPLLELHGMRNIQMIFSILTIGIFYKLAKDFDPQHAELKTIQFTLLPVLSIFWFFIYSEALSLFFVLLSFYTLRHKKYALSWITAFLSILCRQNNIIFILFFVIYHWINNYSFPVNQTKITSYMREVSGFGVTFIFLALFLIINKTPALADLHENPLTIHLENPYQFLLVLTLVYLPLILNNYRKFIRWIKEYSLIFSVWMVGIIIYLLFFRGDNTFNGDAYSFWLHNKILYIWTANIWHKILFYIPITIGFLFLATTSLIEKNNWLIYLFSFLFLALSWLIEPRYTILPFTFFMLFRKVNATKFEVIENIYLVLLNTFLISGIASNKFFL